MRKNKLSESFFDLAAGIARQVLDPDYYEGPWGVDWHGTQVNCNSYQDAVTLINYVRANYQDGWTAMLIKV
jgi:hypothetical protein